MSDVLYIRHKDKHTSSIQRMLDTQNRLNTEAYSTSWVHHARQLTWDYSIAASQEIAEFLESFNQYKWWGKNNIKDLQNMRTELIDAWHFIMSQMIVANPSKYESGVLASAIYEQWKFFLQDEPSKKLGNETVNQTVKALLTQLFAESSGLPEGRETEKVCAYIEFIYLCMHAAEMPIELLEARYIGKSVLNRFRQNSGYKTGQYVKNWGVDPAPRFSDRYGEFARYVEDNVILSDFIDSAYNSGGEMPTESEIYHYLELKYPY